jgi:hypothetical protein
MPLLLCCRVALLFSRCPDAHCAPARGGLAVMMVGCHRARRLIIPAKHLYAARQQPDQGQLASLGSVEGDVDAKAIMGWCETGREGAAG